MRPGVLVVLTLALLAPSVATAASAEAQPAATPAAPAANPDYLFPDLPGPSLVHNGQRFWFKPIFAVVGDTTSFQQDSASLAQVGKQDDASELRAGRLGFLLRHKGNLAWELYTTVDYQERKTRESAVFQIYDLKLTLPIGPVRFTVGKQKEPFAYELIALSVLLPHQERVLLPFFVSRSIGAQFSGFFAGDRVSWTAGAFNDWLDTNVGRGRNGTDYVGRLTALAWEAPGTNRYLHLGLGLRRVGSDDGKMRFAGRPESNVADKFVDTGSFPADHANEILFETLWSHESLSLLAEYVEARVDTPASSSPRFSGYYGTASWILTGESRPYVRAGGYAGGIRPNRRLGAVELAVRYSHLDATDAGIDGGVLDKWSVNLSWWASVQWKIGLSWGDADLDKAGLLGNTKMLLARVQWLY